MRLETPVDGGINACSAEVFSDELRDEGRGVVSRQDRRLWVGVEGIEVGCRSIGVLEDWSTGVLECRILVES